MLRTLFILSLAFVFLTSTKTSAEYRAVSISVETDPEILAAGSETVDSIARIITAAFGVVSSFPPKSDNLFTWRSSRASLRGKSVIIYLTESSSPFVASVFASQGDPSLTVSRFDGEALTIMMKIGDGLVSSVLLFVDRLLFQPSSSGSDALLVERPDAMARTVVALAHEIYGNVQADLELPFKNGKPVEPVDTDKREIRAFQAGIDFLDRLMADSKYNDLSLKIRDDFKEARAREAKVLEVWKIKVCSDALTNP